MKAIWTSKVSLLTITTIITARLLTEAGIAAAEPVAPPSTQQPDAPSANKKLAVVIDDFGNGMTGTADILELPIPLTAAVMPFLSTTKQDAEEAHAKGKAVIVHLPMEPLRGNSRWLGPGAITLDLSDEEIKRRVEAAIDDVPYAEGVNNHMGSKATADQRVMRAVLQVCKERKLMFLDSKTNYHSVAGSIASELGVKYVANEIFLDDNASLAHVQKQVREVKKRLEKQQTCVVIGHVGRPGKQTSQVLRDAIPELQRQAQFVTVRELAQ